MRRVIKSAFDKVAAASVLLLLAALMAGIAVAIRVDGHGPALFRQRRGGEDGGMVVPLKLLATGAGAGGARGVAGGGGHARRRRPEGAGGAAGGRGRSCPAF